MSTILSSHLAAINASNEVGSVDNSVYMYTAEDMCVLAWNASKHTFDRWVNRTFGDIIKDGSETKYRKRFSEGRNKRYFLYTDEALRDFQGWRMKNQANTGRASQETKDATSNVIDMQIAKEYKDSMEVETMGVVPMNNVGTNWTRKQDVANSFGYSLRTIESVVGELNSEGTFAAHIKRGGYHNIEVFYDDYLINAIGMKLKANAMNAGGQKTEGSVIKQDNATDMQIAKEYKDSMGIETMGVVPMNNVLKTVKELADDIGYSERAINYAITALVEEGIFSESSFQKVSTGGRPSKALTDEQVKLVQMKLKANAMNAGGQKTEGSILKQDNAQDLFIGCVATKGTPDEIESLGQHLIAVAQERRLAQQTILQLNEQNQLLVAENKELDDRHTEAVEYIVKYDNLSKYTYVGAETMKKMITDRVREMGILDWQCPPMTHIARKMGVMAGKGKAIECLDTRYCTHWENKEHNNRLETIYNTHYIDEFVGTAIIMNPLNDE